MKKNEINVGRHYVVKINKVLTAVRVVAYRECKKGISKLNYTHYDVFDLATKRMHLFRSAQKFQREVTEAQAKAIDKHGEKAYCLQEIQQ